MSGIGITARRDYILVKPIKETQTESGFELPEATAKNKAEVISVGDKHFYDTEEVLVVGDIVYVEEYVDLPIKKNGEEYFFVSYEYVMGVEDKPKQLEEKINE